MMNKEDPIRIVLADAQPVFREGLRGILAGQEDSYLVQEAGNTGELIAALQAFEPQILILDYNPAYFDPNELTRALALVPRCRLIIISDQRKKENIMRSLEFDVHCYLTKECGKSDVHKAIRYAIRGEKFFCTFIVDLLLAERKNVSKLEMCTPDGLTGREVEIIRLIALGKANKEIAAAIHLSPHTVHTHRRNIMKKLNLHSAVELCSFAIEKGIIRSDH